MNRVLRVELLIDNCLDDRLTNGGTASVSLMAAFIMATTCSLVITSCRSNRLYFCHMKLKPAGLRLTIDQPVTKLTWMMFLTFTVVRLCCLDLVSSD